MLLPDTSFNHRQIIAGRWYAFADLACAAIAGALLIISGDQLGAWPLLIAILPWPARILNGQLPVKRTPFDWYILLFLITAAIGVLTAYNREVAWDKFVLIVAAFMLFYALAGQPPENSWPVNGVLVAAGFIISIYFFLTHNWLEQPPDFAALANIAQAWMSVRPKLALNLTMLHSNDAGGLMAMLAPVLIALFLFFMRRRKWLLLVTVSLVGIILIAGLILSSSRGAWLALFGGLIVWLAWAIGDKISQTISLYRQQVFLFILLFLILIAFAVYFAFPRSPLEIIAWLPGASNQGRLALYPNTINLIADYPLTGSGLGSFPGQYSQYALVSPNVIFYHSHNLFLDITLEQGILGIAMFLAILGTSYCQLGFGHAVAGIPDNELLQGSLLAGLTVIVLHGLVDDPLYGSHALLLLFVYSGMAAAITRAQPLPPMAERFQRISSIILLLATIIFALLSATVYRDFLQSLWQANIGAVRMAQVELDDKWPTNKWQGDSRVPLLAGAEADFHIALQLNGENVTALYRLGLIALARQDFATAVNLLTKAQELNPDHHGIQKALGYSALWNGDMEKAVTLLSTKPEAEYELLDYIGWWPRHGKPELGTRASEALQILQDS